MQSWGTQSRFGVRDTGREPSKSGVIGLLCAALGRPRSAPLGDLAALRMGVRVDREGRLERDYHTAGKDGYYKISGGVERTNMIVSTRYYLADACFLVGLEADDPALLGDLHAALRNPVWPIFLGRKAFVPGEPVWLEDGLWEGRGLEEALGAYPWLCSGGNPPARLRAVIEDPAGSVVVNDSPISFVQQERTFRPRRLRVSYLPMPVDIEEA
jgi:CRISPR system Cascade subunit CasD